MVGRRLYTENTNPLLEEHIGDTIDRCSALLTFIMLATTSFDEGEVLPGKQAQYGLYLAQDCVIRTLE